MGKNNYCNAAINYVLSYIIIFILARGFAHQHHHQTYIESKSQSEPSPAGPEYWLNVAMKSIAKKQNEFDNERIANNIIIFLGDGMSIPTITSARIFKGQLMNMTDRGEGAELSFENFPYTGVSKTYCADAQVADSACSSTAYLCGVKNNNAMIGLKASVVFNDCRGQMNPENHVSSILSWAMATGKSTGFVTTTRVTHATPAGAYAHIANRDWENDDEVGKSGVDPNTCDDIAEQLMLREPGRDINVILGGGRADFLPKDNSGGEGLRLDKRNLIKTWEQANYKRYGKYVSTRSQLLNIDTTKTDYLLGLFAASHLGFYGDQSPNEPTLAEMTEVAVKILRKNPKGFFLLVEGGRIDHAHHNTNAQRALLETIEFDKAITKTKSLVNILDTSVLVTADHSHSFTMSGYAHRGNSIFGFGGISNVDNMPYTTLGYANGPGYKKPQPNGDRYNISNDPIESKDYLQPATVPLLQETHGGDDVLMFAHGPYARFFSGVHQQSDIPYIMGYAACIGPGRHNPYCNVNSNEGNHGWYN